MAYTEKLAQKIRKALAHLPNVKEKKMFGGLAFLVNEKMCINAGANKIMCRIGPTLYEDVIKIKGCSAVSMKGRVYKGYVHIDEESLKDKKDFDFWIELALDYNKEAKSSKK
ncbi:MAG: TfoX/Sxy family protein [Ferruginibacter sp.]